MDVKTHFIERTWEYTRGTSTGTVTLPEVRRAPYHRRIKHLGSDTKKLAELDLRDLHSQGWRSRLTVYDLRQDRRLPPAESCECKYVQLSNEYHTWELEELRSRVLEKSEPSNARLAVAENILPPLLEVLGSSLQVDPELFGQHIGNSWGNRSSSINASSAQCPGWTGSWLDFAMRYPRLVAVSHPSALKHKNPVWREHCLKLGSRFLQGRQLLPILDTKGDERGTDKVQCITFEHITVSFKLNAGTKDSPDRSGQGWQGLVLFPHSFKEWKDGNLKVEKYQNIAPRGNVRIMREQLRISDESSTDPDVGNWLAALRLLSDDEKQSLSPFNVLELLWREVLDHWQLHLAQVALVVETLSHVNQRESEDEEDDSFNLRRQQQLRAVIVQGISVLADIDDSIRIAAQLCATNFHLDENHTQEYGLRDLRSQFLHVKSQLERHGPTIEHHIGIITLDQQVRLAKKQYEESQKAIKQADTIKRLTILAFIYIPVQTASAVFGMNLRELQPNPSIWTFVTVTAVLLVLTLSAAGWYPITHFLRRQANKVFGSFRHTLGSGLASMGIHVERLQRPDSVLGRRTPPPSWYGDPLPLG